MYELDTGTRLLAKFGTTLNGVTPHLYRGRLPYPTIFAEVLLVRCSCSGVMPKIGVLFRTYPVPFFPCLPSIFVYLSVPPDAVDSVLSACLLFAASLTLCVCIYMRCSP